MYKISHTGPGGKVVNTRMVSQDQLDDPEVFKL
jgi:hypothetical protein